MVVCNSDLWPLVLVFWSGEVTKEDVAAYLEFKVGNHDRVRSEGTRYIEISTSAPYSKFNAARRAELADFGRSLTPEDHALLIANHLVVSDAIARGVLKAITWIVPKGTM